MGDSYASGEGAPDAFGGYDADGHGDQHEDWDTSVGGGSAADIDAERCHRSRNAPRAIAAGYMAADFPDLSVPFTSVACSGAAIVEQGVFKTDPIEHPGGLLRSYDGADNLYNFNPRPGITTLSPQVTQLNNKVSSKIDALVIGVGGNDAGFGAFIVECSEIFLISHSGSNCKTNTELRDFRDARLYPLPGTSTNTSPYDRLARALAGRHPPPEPLRQARRVDRGQPPPHERPRARARPRRGVRRRHPGRAANLVDRILRRVPSRPGRGEAQRNRGRVPRGRVQGPAERHHARQVERARLDVRE